MDEIERTPQETTEGREGAGDSERTALNDATLDPGAFIEQSGEIQQAEAITTVFTAVVEASNAGSVPSMAEVLPMETGVLATNEGEQSSSGDAGEGDGTGGEQETLTDREISAPPDREGAEAESGSVITGTVEISAIPLEETIPAEPSSEEGEQSSSGDAREGDGTGGEQETLTDREISASPDREVTEADTSGGSEGEGAGVTSAIPLEGDETTTTTETPEAGTESTEQPDQAPMENETGTGAETGMDTAAVAPDENVEGEVSEEDLSEAEEGWTPPDVYMYYGPDGKIVVVGADGKPIGCPPIVASADGASFFAYYPGMVDENGDPIKFDIKDYKGSLTDLYLYQDSSGNMIVVDADGNPVSSPPSLTSPDGATFYAYYGKAGTSEQVQLQAYKSSLTDLYLYQDSTGNMIVVDADGNPVSSPPSLTSLDGATFYAYYGKAGTSESVQLSAYKGSLTDLYLYQDSTGNMIVVDADGNPVVSPPSLTSPDGATFYAYYGKAGTSESVQLSAYKGSLTDLYLYQDSSGTTIVVDADGNPVASPPKLTSADGSTFYASYDSSGAGESVQLQAYKGSLTDVYLYQDSSGKMIVVDATGKPLTSQPTITSPTGVTFYASYAGGYKTGDMVQLTYYKPPSSPPKNPSPT